MTFPIQKWSLICIFKLHAAAPRPLVGGWVGAEFAKFKDFNDVVAFALFF